MYCRFLWYIGNCRFLWYFGNCWFLWYIGNCRVWWYFGNCRFLWYISAIIDFYDILAIADFYDIHIGICRFFLIHWQLLIVIILCIIWLRIFIKEHNLEFSQIYFSFKWSSGHDAQTIMSSIAVSTSALVDSTFTSSRNKNTTYWCFIKWRIFESKSKITSKVKVQHHKLLISYSNRSLTDTTGVLGNHLSRCNKFS